MYTLIDEQNISKDGMVFNKNHPEYILYVNWCDQGNTPDVKNPDIYQRLEGRYKGKRFFVCRKTEQGRQKTLANSRASRFSKVRNLKEKFVSQIADIVTSFLMERGLSDTQISNRFANGDGIFTDIRNRDYASLVQSINSLKASADIPARYVKELKKSRARILKVLKKNRTDF